MIGSCIEVGIGPFGPHREPGETASEEARAPSRTISKRASPTVGVMKAGRGSVRLAKLGFTRLADDQTRPVSGNFIDVLPSVRVLIRETLLQVFLELLADDLLVPAAPGLVEAVLGPGQLDETVGDACLLQPVR